MGSYWPGWVGRHRPGPEDLRRPAFEIAQRNSADHLDLARVEPGARSLVRQAGVVSEDLDGQPGPSARGVGDAYASSELTDADAAAAGLRGVGSQHFARRAEHPISGGSFEPGTDAGDHQAVADYVVLAWLPHAHIRD